MSRWIWCGLCLAFGLGSLVCGLLVPAHVRAVDVSVLWKAGLSTPSVSDRGLTLLSDENLGAAQLLFQAAQSQKLAGRANLGAALSRAFVQRPELILLGRPAPRLDGLTHAPASMALSQALTNCEPFTSVIIRPENRERMLAFLVGSARPIVQRLLACRSITNTAMFSPSASASGQALDAAIATCGLLVDLGHLKPEMGERIGAWAAEATRSGRLEHLEPILMDFLSLGQRFNWAQLADFVGQVEEPETLRQLTILVRQSPVNLPVIFTAVDLSGQPASVARYLMDYSQTGWTDLKASLAFGTGGVKELLSLDRRICTSSLAHDLAQYAPCGAFVDFAAFYSWHNPWLALALKWLLYLGSGYWLAMALRQARPALSVLEQPLHVRGLHVVREMLFGLGFLVVVLLLTEPFLTEETQRVEFPFRLRLPAVGSMISSQPKSAPSSFMNKLSLLTLLLFFVLQALIYVACLVKLAEIRRQRIVARVKLRLLENEDHLFDAGLYLGFVGTIISLILVSLGVIRPSLMAAYSSTSFGIIFVSVFKIFHLRPLRRKLLLEAEASSGQPMTEVGQPSLATSA